MSEFVWQIIAGLIIATVSAWVTVQLSLRKFRTERWWELKVESYKKVIEALHHSKTYNDQFMDATMEGRELPETRKEELFKQARKGLDEIIKAIDVGAFSLSEKALSRLREYQLEIREVGKTQNFFEYLEGEQKTTKECLNDFIEIAKKDLKTR